MKIITKAASLLLFTVCFCSIKANAQLASEQRQTAIVENSTKVQTATTVKLASDAPAPVNNDAKINAAANARAQQLLSAQGIEPAVKPITKKATTLPPVSDQGKAKQ